MERYVVERSYLPYKWQVILETRDESAALAAAYKALVECDFVRVRIEHERRIKQINPKNERLNSNRELIGLQGQRARHKDGRFKRGQQA